MPTLEWLRNEFNYGYDSGNVLSIIPNRRRFSEERKIGGSYRRVFRKAVLPYIKPDSAILELGPGKGSWSRALLKHIPFGRLHTLDFQDVEKWLKPEEYDGRLYCHKVEDNSFSCLEDESFDFFWSFGVLCHNDQNDIKEILENSLPKMKNGGFAVHQYGDWNKLNTYGWRKGGIPIRFSNLADDKMWWPRNSQDIMSDIAVKVGWKVVCSDLELVKRDSIILLQRDYS